MSRSNMLRRLSLASHAVGVGLIASLFIACGGGGGSSSGSGSGSGGGTHSASQLPQGVYGLKHLYPGDPNRNDAVPTADGLAYGGGEYYFLCNGQLVSFDPKMNAFKFLSAGLSGSTLIFDGAPWVIGPTGVFQTVTAGSLQGFNLGFDLGPMDVAEADGAGHAYLVFEGRRANTQGPAVDPQLVAVDLATRTYRSFSIHTWGAADDSRNTSYPYTGLVIDAAKGQAWILSSYFQEICRIDLTNGDASHFPDSRIDSQGSLAMDHAGNLVTDQFGGLLRMSPSGSYSLQAWPSGFKPGNWEFGGNPERHLLEDTAGRAWVTGDGPSQILACMAEDGESKSYQFPYQSGGSDGWLSPRGLAWDGRSLWVSAEGNGSDTTGVLHEFQIRPDSTSVSPEAPSGTLSVSANQAAEGSAIHFQADAAGNGSLFFQWFRNGAPLSGANSAILDLPGVTDLDAGSYSCEVDNHLYGATKSSVLGPTGLDVVAFPKIAYLAVDKSEIQKGDRVSLTSWFSGGQGRVDPGGEPLLSGVALSLSPLGTTDYTITVTNALGASQTATCHIQVDDTAGILESFSGVPAQVELGNSTSLAWLTSVQPTDLSLQDDLGVFGPVDATTLSTYQMTPHRRQRIHLSFTAPSGSGSGFVEVAAHGLEPLLGQPGGPGYLDGQGDDARLSFPGPLASRADGTLIYAESMAPVLRIVDSTGQVSTVAGRWNEPGDVDGLAGAARFTAIKGLAGAPDGSVFISDSGKIKKLSPDGAGQTVQTLFSGPFESGPICLDPEGDIYMSEHDSGKVIKITPAGVVTIYASNLSYPGSLLLKPDGSLLVVSGMNWLYEIDTDGSVTQKFPQVLAGDPSGGYGQMSGLTMEPNGQIYLVGSSGVFTLDGAFMAQSLCHVDGAISGTGSYSGGCYSSAGFLWLEHQGYGAQIEHLSPGSEPYRVAGLILPFPSAGGAAIPTDVLERPLGVALAPAGQVLVSDGSLGRILRVAPSGAAQEVPLGQGAGSQVCSPLWVDASGGIYFTGGGGITILRLDPVSGQSSLVVGQGNYPDLSDGDPYQASALDVRGLVGDHAGSLYFTSTVSEDDGSIGQAYIRKVTSGGQVITLAGGRLGFVDGSSTQARFGRLRSIALDPQGDLIIADAGNNAIRKMTPDGMVSTLAGLHGPGFQDGDGASAAFSNPTGVAVDRDGYIFVADQGNSALRQISPDGQVTTLVGGPGHPGARPGPLNYASLFSPADVQVTPDGDLLVTDQGRVFQLTAPRMP